MLEDLEALFKFFLHLSVSPGKNYRQIYGKSKASHWRNLSTGTPPKFSSTILCFVALVYDSYYFQNSHFWTIDSQTNTVISHTFAYSSRWRRKPWRGQFKKADSRWRLSKLTNFEFTDYWLPNFYCCNISQKWRDRKSLSIFWETIFCRFLIGQSVQACPHNTKGVYS